jgi:hypothetical protein
MPFVWHPEPMLECARTTRFCFVPVEPKPALLSAQNKEPFSSQEAKALVAPIVAATAARTAVTAKVVIVRVARRGCGRRSPMFLLLRLMVNGLVV